METTGKAKKGRDLGLATTRFGDGETRELVLN
jgi:hypothetical protein